jgi:hypothetical protein
MINCENSLSNLDIFKIDSVFLQRQRRKTKSKLGGILTLLIPIICSIAFALLYVNNSNKSDIVTNELISTNTLSYSEQAYIEWNTDIVDVSTIQPFEMITESNKRNVCYQNRGPFTNTEMPICNYGTDLNGEENGVGYVFKLKAKNNIKYVLPIGDSDYVVYHEKNIVAYVIKTYKNQICVYLIGPILDSKCYYFKVDIHSVSGGYTSIINYAMIKNNNNLCLSIYNNDGITYLFKNHTLVQSKTNLNSNYPSYFLSETTFVERNSTHRKIYFTNSSTTTSITTPLFDILNNEIYGENLYYYNSIYRLHLIQTSNNTARLVLEKYDFNNVSVDSILITVFDQNITSSYTINSDTVTANFYNKLYNKIIISITENKNCNICNTQLFAVDIESNTIINTTYTSIYNKTIKRIIRVYSTNVILIEDYNSVNNKLITLSLTAVDINLQTYTISDPSNSDGWFYFNIMNIVKVDNTFILTFLNTYYPSSSNDWSSIINTGGILECNNQNCTSLYTTSFNISPEPFLDLNTTVGSIHFYNKNITIRIKDVLGSISENNDYKINTLQISNNSDIYYPKTLYTVINSNNPIINTSSTSFTNYYIVDNSKTGHDKKFTCYPQPISNKMYLLDNIIYPNLLSCMVNNIINIPFIFDNNLAIYKKFDFNFINIENNNLTGIFLVNLNPFITKTTITSTKAPFFTIVANTFSVYSVLLTFFMFIKNKVFLLQNKDEITRKNTVINDSEVIRVQDSSNFNDIQIDINQSTSNEPTFNDQHLNDQKNVELSNIRHSHLMETTN